MKTQIEVNELRLGYKKWGNGAHHLVFIHGNVASKNWMDIAATHLDARFTLHGIDWRGCGDSDKPEVIGDFENYSLETHARDILAAMDALGLAQADVITHSTGGIICSQMQLIAPERIGRILALSPVAPMGLPFPPAAREGFDAMKASKKLTRDVMATTMPALFEPRSLEIGQPLAFTNAATDLQRQLFDTIVDQTFGVADGIWFGTPHNLNDEFESQNLAGQMANMHHKQRILWGEHDHIIPRVDLERMAAEMPDCELIVVPGVGHSMNVETPLAFANAINEFLTVN